MCFGRITKNAGALALFPVTMILFGTVSARAQAPDVELGPRRARALTVEEVVDHRSFPAATPIRLSPDGRRLAYTVEGAERSLGSTMPLMSDAEDAWTHIVIVDLETGETTELGKGASAWAPSWSPDGSRLAFHATLDGRPQLWIWSADDTRTRKLSDAVLWTAYTRTSPRWTPDGRALVVKLLPEGRSLEVAVREARPRTGVPIEQEHGTTATPLRSPATASEPRVASWLTWRTAGDLARVDVASGEMHRLTRGRRPVWWAVSPDGSFVAFMDLEGAKSIRPTFTLAVVSVAGGAPQELDDRILQTWGEAVSWSPGGRHLAYFRGGAEAGLFVVAAGGGRARRLASPVIDAGASRGPVWTPDGEHLLACDGDIWRVGIDGGPAERESDGSVYRAQRAVAPVAGSVVAGSGDRWLLRIRDPETGRTGFAWFDADSGAFTRVHLEHGFSGSVVRADVTADGGRVVASFAGARRPLDLWLLADDLSRDRRVSTLNPVYDNVDLGETRPVEWETASGDTLSGTLLIPPGRDVGERLPMVVEIYGGNRGLEALNDFDRYRQLLATHGYVVFVPDVPLGVGTPMRDHVISVEPGVDRVVDLGLVDARRVGVYGHSYGGYGVLALLVGSDRFAAGVASAAQGDMTGVFGRLAEDGSSRTWWAESGQGRMGATPWEAPQAYVENSPVYYLDQVRAPVLLLHGTEDRNTPVYLAGEVFTGLRRLDRTATFVRYEGEGHSWRAWSRGNKIDYWSRVLGWFDSHM